MIAEGIQEMNCGATNNPDLGIIFRTAKDIENNFLPAKEFHRCNKKQLEYILKLIEKYNITTEKVKYEITRRIN